MTLAVGTRLGPYEITAKLGEGGMGEVYRATDSKLKREVAIKVLPAAFAEDKERLARFEREAQVLAQLHHPRIASIFGLEESDGVRALVMELVEGQDLSSMLARGPLPVDAALAIARQIAEALEAAHERGIVHRDLKPANVKVQADATVKVLDFGLAKATDSISRPADTQSPTRTAGTEFGVILGTAAYMAPEQARGAAVDKRADIWAFGVVLYEMLSGRSLFAGPTLSDTLAGVLKSEIDWSALPPGTPMAIRRLLRRCLERNLKNRLHDIADARLVLDEEIDGTEDEQPRAVARAPTQRRRGPAIVAAIAVLALGAGAGWLLRRPEPAALGAGARWALAIPDGLTLSTRALPHLALSEDGRLQVAVVEDSARISHLMLRSIDAFEPTLVADTEGAATPFFSPDGNWIGFIRNQSLMKIPSAGGPPVEVARISSEITTRGATWSRDGFIYYADGVGSGLSRVSENGGPVTAATTLTDARDERTHRWPQALPDGSAVLFTCDTLSSSEFYDDARIEAVRPATGERHVLVEGASQARYGPAGRLVFARGGSLFSIAFEPRTLTVHGTPELVAQGVATDVASGAVQFALSSSGAALWAPGGLSGQYHLSWVERNGAETPVAIPQVPYAEQQLSPDGSRVALVGGAGGVADLWVADLRRSALTRLTLGENVGSPVWSPDGARVVYRVRRKGSNERPWELVWRPADGSRDAEMLLDSEHYLIPSGFTPDGEKLIYSTERAESSDTDVYLLPLAGARAPELLMGGPGRKTGAAVSPDGRFVAYASSEGGQPTVFVRPFPSGDGRWQISTPTGVEPRWSRDRSELLYRAGMSLYRVPVELRHGFFAGKPELLVDRVASAGAMFTYNPAPEGGRIFTARSPEGRGALRTLYLDLGFARRLEAPSRASAGQQ